MPDDGVGLGHPVLLQQHVERVDAVVALHDPAGAAEFAADDHLELVLALVLEEEGGGPDFVDQVQLHLGGEGQHLRDEGRGLVPPGDAPAHLADYVL